ncbi:hypothetical protein HBI81_244250 [Parastagonospora nodorum]|nr:hypothetical protein HBI73_239410 [Parastagonospora nodorum]KAH5620234.1 hypothetical protein HBI23_243110 [Parastagonospora nodorum]KAH5706837.1 hypothetical protein HBI18_252240 [Parastagonospora nodorum]KAH6511164.1 hypothetical protein HBI81_244250 [Parastagonospora nodorum]
MTSVPPALTRDIVVRAYNIVAYANGSAQQKDLVHDNLLETAQAILELYRTPTPFKGKYQSSVTLPDEGFPSLPFPRRPSLENHSELGYPVTWSAHSEGRRTATKNAGKEFSIFERLTQGFRSSTTYADWLRARQLQTTAAAALQTTTPPAPSAEFPTERNSRPVPSLLADRPVQSLEQELRQYREREPSDSSNEWPSPFLPAAQRRQDSIPSPILTEKRQPSQASIETNSTTQAPGERRRRKRKARKSRQHTMSEPSGRGEQQADHQAVPQHQTSSPLEGPFLNRLRSSNPLMQRRISAQLHEIMEDQAVIEEAPFPQMPDNPNLVPLGEPKVTRSEQGPYREHSRRDPMEGLRRERSRPQVPQASVEEVPHFTMGPPPRPTPRQRAAHVVNLGGSPHSERNPGSARSQSVTRSELTDMFAQFRQVMAHMMREHMSATQSRYVPPPMNSPAGNPDDFYMSGGNGRAPDPHQRPTAPRDSVDTMAHGHAPGPQHSQWPDQSYRNSARLSDRPQYADQPGAPSRFSRALTPAEQRIAEDNAKVKAMGGSLKFAADQIGFFMPNLSYHDYPDDVVEISGKTYYRNVRDFLDAAKLCIASQTMAEHTVRNGLHQCFKGTALLWYQSNLGIDRRLEVIGGEGLERWEEKLKHFRIQPSLAISRLQRQKYGPKDLLDGRSLAEWFLKVKRLCQDAGYGHDDDNQYVAHAWNLLDARIRVHLQNPGTSMTSDDFLAMLEERKYELSDVFRQDAAMGKFSFNRPSGSSGQQAGTFPSNGNYGNRNSRQSGSAPPRIHGIQSGNDNAQGISNPLRQQGNAPANQHLNNQGQRNGYGSRNPNYLNGNNGAYNGQGYNGRAGQSNNQGQGSRPPGNNNGRYDKVQGAYGINHNQVLNSGILQSAPTVDSGALAFLELTAKAPPESPHVSNGQVTDEDHSSQGSRDFSPGNWAAHQDDNQLDDTLDHQFFSDDEEDEDYYGINVVDVVPASGSTKGPRRSICMTCEEVFTSSNRLHSHIRAEHQTQVCHAYTVTVPDNNHTTLQDRRNSTPKADNAELLRRIRIIKSSAPPPVDGATTVRNWYELRMKVRSKREGKNLTVIPDT